MHAPSRETLARPSAQAIDRAKKKLVDRLGDHKVLFDPDALEPYARDQSHGGRFLPDLVVRAESADDVQAVFEIAREGRIWVTPRGLGSGKSGGALPIHGGIVLSMERMTRIKEINHGDMLTVVEPGVITQDMMSAVENEGLFYPDRKSVV